MTVAHHVEETLLALEDSIIGGAEATQVHLCVENGQHERVATKNNAPIHDFPATAALYSGSNDPSVFHAKLLTLTSMRPLKTAVSISKFGELMGTTALGSRRSPIICERHRWRALRVRAELCRKGGAAHARPCTGC